MGRPREHDQRTATALLAAAERVVEEQGVEALSVRGLAGEVGTTTRAVYSLFGSKEGMVSALGAQAFELLGAGLQALKTTDDPVADLIEAGMMFRRFATEHPSLFALGVQRRLPNPTAWEQIRPAASAALDGLKLRIERLARAGLLGGRTVSDATFQFHALCEGLASVELRRMLAPNVSERIWREALTALVTGFERPARPAP